MNEGETAADAQKHRFIKKEEGRKTRADPLKDTCVQIQCYKETYAHKSVIKRTDTQAYKFIIKRMDTCTYISIQCGVDGHTKIHTHQFIVKGTDTHMHTPNPCQKDGCTRNYCQKLNTHTHT